MIKLLVRSMASVGNTHGYDSTVSYDGPLTNGELKIFNSYIQKQKIFKRFKG